MRILVVSHGELASGLINSYEMIAGENPQLDSLSLTNAGIANFTQKFMEKLDSYGNEKVLILCDIKGGSPFNESYKYQMTHPDRVSIICGVNLPILIEVGMLVTSIDDLDVLYQMALSIGKQSIEGISKEIVQEEENEELEF
ncbi:PTS sugar transporter subunit IIA [Granulicatella seriolae]|uniref:PTS sugar transporter subunit IIA n=1 Tax=Granulicatella seriolae TaxID=2967226 RepID=A0ABT1WMU9_9LACT|nr:PTS sugar transporter subunit IIA [Granulicatella seriolae]